MLIPPSQYLKVKNYLCCYNALSNLRGISKGLLYGCSPKEVDDLIAKTRALKESLEDEVVVMIDWESDNKEE